MSREKLIFDIPTGYSLCESLEVAGFAHVGSQNLPKTSRPNLALGVISLLFEIRKIPLHAFFT